uniref:Cytochrome c oxidase assembly factor 5 n=1 Tax=Ornithorhynchus anatinus TaxID=9258 RepID=A0A6I8NED7_ORNAN
MPRYYEDKPEEEGACAGVREDLGLCLLQSDCVLKEGKSPRQCLKEGNCKALKVSFFECKRSMPRRFSARSGHLLSAYWAQSAVLSAGGDDGGARGERVVPRGAPRASSPFDG